MTTITLLAEGTAGGLELSAITQYLFWIATVAMACGTAFFWLERDNLPSKYRSTMVVAGLVTGVAAFHYFRMAGVYSQGEFPTEYRYIDWIITTPLLLIKFPLLLGMGKGAGKFLGPLILLDIAMVVTAYIAEVSPLGGSSWWTFFLIACAFEAAIVYVLFAKMNTAIMAAPAPLASALQTMRLFILVGWAIYPIGFLMALAGPAGGDLREVFYNVADVINKVGFGLVAYHGIKTLAELEEGKNAPRASRA